MFTLPDSSPKRKTPHARPDRYRLTAEILARSEASTWDAAKREWKLERVYRDEPDTCLCGHYPILQHCIIENVLNGNRACVGSVCVNKFLGLPSEAIFRGLDRIAGDPGKTMTVAALEYAQARGWVNSCGAKFYRDTMRKPHLTWKQRAWRVDINTRVLARAGMAAVGKGVPCA
jgi:hypothetical protein